ncbi:MAG: hypothetical protein AB1898_14270 [Acidobacteriota bacterium]
MFSAKEAGSLRRGQFHYLPVVPGKMEFAEEVRIAILAERPDVVAVELPSTLESAYLRAVERLPELSVILYEETKRGEAVYIPVEICDPFVEAIRTAHEVGAEVFFVDPDIGERPHLKDLFPDTYAVRRIGLEKYVEAYRLYPQPKEFDVSRHAAGIAWKLQSSDPLARVLVVVSLNLLDAVMECMEQPQAEPLARVRREGVQVMNLHPDCLAETVIEFPFLQALYETRRYGLPSIDDAEESTGEMRVVTAVQGLDVIEVKGGPEDPAQEVECIVRRTARHVNWLPHGPGSPESATTTYPSQDGSRFSLLTDPQCLKPIDRQRLHLRLFAEAERRYERNTREKLAHWQRRLIARYSRNLALVGRQLIAGLFDLTVAARSVVDDNFAWELWELAGTSPFQKVSSDLRTVNVAAEEIWLDTRTVRLRRRLPKQKGRARPIGLRQRAKENAPGEWAQQFDGESICSYPPEDIVLENYGVFLKKKGKSILSEERSRVEPFQTSILDGIDLRETLRHWHERKLYVREFQKISGEVGAVVVIFDEDRENRYHWCTTWLGEHSQESDMAFYSTDPYTHVVGPGIARAEYGGFLLSYPPRRMLNVWQDPDYWFAESKPELLLLAALDYTLERFVVYVGARPPRSIFRSIAARMGRKIVYIPIGQLSPISLKKIRVVHVLDSHERRATARNYIW